MKVKQLIKFLRGISKVIGDKDVYLSGDSEGNYYSTLGKKTEDSIYYDANKIILYPYTDIDFDEMSEWSV